MSNPYDKAYFNEIDSYARNRRLRREVVRAVMQFDPKFVIDVGCGQGYLIKYLYEKYHIHTYGIDISNEGIDLSKYDNKFKYPHAPIFLKLDVTNGLFLPDKIMGKKFADVVVSTDFFEHLPEDKIEFVYSEMQRLGEHVVARVCTKREKHTSGIDTHATVKPKQWWIDKLPGCHFIW